jgi:type II secretory ATPase GspE/PulE/Tfp pilus assembly ATPase PilB-like protein
MNPKIGLTFASAMRGFLRADPDIIMIGEIRDAETAKIAIEASLTGHLVLSTLHTNNASESVVRLLDLGMDPMNFADSLLGIVAQRLVRALCHACAEERPLDPKAWDELVQEYVDGGGLDVDTARQRSAGRGRGGRTRRAADTPRRGLRALRGQGLQGPHGCVRNPPEQPDHSPIDPGPRQAERDL